VIRLRLSDKISGDDPLGDVDRLVDLRQPASLDHMAEVGLVAIVMPRRTEFECAIAHELRLQFRFELGIFRFQIDADARQDARQRLDQILPDLDIVGVAEIVLQDIDPAPLAPMAGYGDPDRPEGRPAPCRGASRKSAESVFASRSGGLQTAGLCLGRRFANRRSMEG